MHGARNVNFKYICIIKSFSTIWTELGFPTPNPFIMSPIFLFYFVAQLATFRQQIQFNIWCGQGCFIESIKERCSAGAFVSGQTGLV